MLISCMNRRYFRKITIATALVFICSIIIPAAFLPVDVYAAVQAEYYVSPQGNDNNPGTQSLPFRTMSKARDVVKTINANMTGDIVVYFRGGQYDVNQTITFNEGDSGSNGYNIIYKAYPGETPVFEGGTAVAGWMQHSEKIWKTNISSVSDFRQLYVNGVRAQRASNDFKTNGLSFYIDQNGRKTGIVVNDADIGYYGNAGDIEFHWQEGWKDVHLPVDRIIAGEPGKKIIMMKQPEFDAGLSGGVYPGPVYNGCVTPFYIENAYELLDSPGEWYFDRTSCTLYYYPRTCEDISSSEAYVGRLEYFMKVEGSSITCKVHNIQFQGFTFQHGTWLRPNTNGFDHSQASYIKIAEGIDQVRNEVTPGQIQVNNAENVKFERNVLMYMGSAGITLINGVKNTEITGNIFYDLSEAAIIFGDFKHDYIGTGEEVCKDNIVKDNVVRKTGQEFWGSVAITAFYVDNLQILHNDISDVPYSGISVGWGWASKLDSTTCRNNKINYNKITDVLKRCRDGGHIYTLGQQPNSEITNNYIKGATCDAGGIYNYEGSAFFNVSNNVADLPSTFYWLFIWCSTIHDITANNNYTTTTNIRNDGTNCSVTNTSYVADENSWTAQAQNIIAASGLESGYQDILSLLPGQYPMLQNGLLLWLKSDAGITKDSNNKVVSWADLSGNQNSALQTNPDCRPALIDNVVNHIPSLRFDGVNDNLLVDKLKKVRDTYTMFMVTKPASVKDYNQQIYAGSGWGQFLFHTNSTGGVYVGTGANSNQRIEPGDGAGTGTVSTGVVQQFSYVFSDGTSKLYKDGILKASKNITVPDSWDGFYIGQATSNTINGDFFEILIYNRALSDAERANVEKYLRSKYCTIPDTGMKLWLKADTGATRDSGNHVSSWWDCSGNGNKAVQSAGTYKPLWIKDAVNGLPALRFDGIDDYMTVSGLTGISQTYTLVFIMKPSVNKDYNQKIFAGSGWGQFMFHTNTTGGIYVGSGALASQRIEPGDGPGAGTLAPNTWQKYAYTFNNGTVRFYKNAALLATKTITAGSPWTGLSIGEQFSNTINGDIAEMLVYDTALTSTQIQSINDYLTNKYTITTN